MAVVVDDVPISFQARAFADLADIERIEVPELAMPIITLRITGAKVIVTCPGRNFITLKIETDEGICGWATRR